MKKTFLIRANMLLGALSLLLAGCHTTKKAAAKSAPEAPEQQAVGVAEDRVICMYGIPAAVYEEQRKEEEERMREQERQRADSLRADSVGSRPDRVMLKYGVPYPRTVEK